MKLSQIQTDKAALITAINVSEFYFKKLKKFGIVKDGVICLIGKSPFGGTIEVKVNGTRLGISRNLAEGITVKYV